RKTCAKFSQDIGLGDFLFLGKGVSTYGEIPSNMLADVFESLVAAIFLDGGWDAAKTFVLRFIQPEVERVAREVIMRLFSTLLDTAPTLGAGLDWKSSLQELTASRGMGAPSYVVTSTGPDHDKEFTATVVVTDVEYGTGVGRTKKEAELKAAAAAWNALESA
ncbi:MAG: ribonuclease III family protein, partial [Mycobacterium sp.]|uniref:ribonuclease III family protein n=1 Tax=Mycobacterium sp. TaxID=1785 RepID=UPI00389986E0